jgi:hypothetical protein
MRRKEFGMHDREEIEAFLREMDHGFLGTVSDAGEPRVTPLNYVYHNGNVYFHGSRIGEKMRSIAANPKVCFSVAKPFSQIPSYWIDPDLACPATVFFKSVLITGTAEEVADLAEKADVFTALMNKLQPEGGYAPIDPDDERYRKQLAGTAVVKIRVESMSAKFKFGQNWNETRRETITDRLLERGHSLDEETVRMIGRYCPFHREGE